MKVKNIPLQKAVGHILVHNQVGADGRRLIKKGRLLTPEDIETLESLGKTAVYVAILEAEDLDENEAARRVSNELSHPHFKLSSATTGRVNLIATTAGLLKINVEALLALNEIDGITLATVSHNSVVQPKTILGTVKIIPYAVPQTKVEAAVNLIRAHQPLVDLKPFVVDQAVLITTGSEAARSKVVDGFTPALRDRLARCQTGLIEGPYVPESEEAICAALRWALDQNAKMILVAGETSVMDVDDITPQAIRAIGGIVVHHGAPVEPGNLLLLAYHGETPIVGAPGCAKSKSYNVVDMVLPRLVAGERLTRRDLLTLGHGGYLQ